MMFAKIMLLFFVVLAIYSVVISIRSCVRPIEATQEKLHALRKSLLLSSWVLVAACANAIHALTTGQHYLLLVSLLLFSFVLPLIVQYVRVKAALKTAAQR